MNREVHVRFCEGPRAKLPRPTHPERMQCPLDFVAIPAIIALGATLGRKIGIRPKCKSDWLLIPEEAAPQFRDDAAPRNGMMPPPDSEMIAPPITE